MKSMGADMRNDITWFGFKKRREMSVWPSCGDGEAILES